jgi:hypothetical protein
MSKQKRKGYDYEMRTAELLNGLNGCRARRNMMSGALPQEGLDCDVYLEICSNYAHTCDNADEDRWLCGMPLTTCDEGNCIKMPTIPYRVEVKARKAPPVYQQKAMKQGDGIAVLWWTKQGKGENGTQNGSECWVLMRWDRFKELMER